MYAIIIPTYNYPTTLRRAVESALAQEGDHTVIVVDDGSDELVDLSDLDCVYVATEHMGVCHARNTGIDHALLTDAEWVQFLDADDTLVPRKVLTQIEHTTSDVSWCPVRLIRNNKYSTLLRHEFDSFQNQLDQDYVPQTGSFVFSRSVVENVRWDETIDEFTVLAYLRAVVAYGYTLNYVPQTEATWDRRKR